MEKPTLKSLSRKLGLHPSLISRVLRGAVDARVSEAKRQLILATAHDAGYRPNRMGRSLRARASNVIALMSPDLTNPFHSLFFRGAESAARRAGFEVILAHLADVDESGELVDSVTGGLVDGVLVACAWQPDPRLDSLKAAGLPYVVINRPSGNADDLQFLPDDAAIGALAASTLLGLGHRRVAAVFSDMRLGGMRLRRDAFIQAAREQAPGCDVIVHEDVDTVHNLRALLGDLISRPRPSRPSALFCAHSQHAAIAAEEVTLRHQLRVPRDLTILGCGTSMDAAIASVCIPAEAIGADGMTALLALVAGRPAGPGAMYRPQLNAGITMARWPPGS